MVPVTGYELQPSTRTISQSRAATAAVDAAAVGRLDDANSAARLGAVVSAAGACQQFLLMANSGLAVPTVRRLAQKQEAPRIRIPVPPMILLTPGQHRTIFKLIDLLLPGMVIGLGGLVWSSRQCMQFRFLA